MEMNTSPAQFERMSTAQRGEILDWTPGRFRLRDTWFGVAHAPDISVHASRRVVHSRPVFLWRDTARIRAAEFHPDSLEQMRSRATDFTGGTGEYPVAIRYGLVWIWYGNPANAAAERIPDVPFIGPDEIVPEYMRGTEYFNCTYELVMENVLDLTHIDFVHRNFAAGEDAESDTIRFLSTSETVTVIREVKRKHTPEYQRKMGIDAECQDVTVFTHVHLRNGTTFFHARLNPGLAMPILQTNVPEGSNRTRLTFAFGGHECPSRQYRRTWPRTSPAVAAQDERVLRPQNLRYLQPNRRPDLSTRFDAAGLQLRVRMQQLIERQMQGDYSYLSDYPGEDIATTLGVRRIGPRRARKR